MVAEVASDAAPVLREPATDVRGSQVSCRFLGYENMDSFLTSRGAAGL